jgi:branched-chain amino acid transport system substrate-binding protein
MGARNWGQIARASGLAAWSVLAAQALGQTTQGVSKNELVVGSIQDLSGPTAASGRQLRNGLSMRANEINQEGGVNGRLIRLIVEDSGAEPRRVSVAVEKLIHRDHVFAVLGQMGAAQNLAALPSEAQSRVINFLPVTGEREMYEPPSPFKVAFWPPYLEQTKTGILYLIQRKKARRVCAVYADDEFGAEVLRGASSALAAASLPLVEKIAVTRGGSELSAAPGRIKAAACDLVVLGVGAREAQALVAEVHRLGHEPDFVGTSALYSAIDHVAAGRATDGLYAVHTVTQPYRDDASKLVRDWAAAYVEQFREEPAVLAVYGYYIMDLFAKVAAKAGPALTLEKFEAVLESTTFPRDMFGSPEFHVTATDRLGSRKVRISEIVNGRWVPVTTLLDLALGGP